MSLAKERNVCQKCLSNRTLNTELDAYFAGDTRVAASESDLYLANHAVLTNIPSSLLARMIEVSLDFLSCVDEDRWFDKVVSDKVAPNYSKVVTKKMAFEVMRRKLANKHYLLLEDFSEDVKLIASNCLRYNALETDVSKVNQ